MINKNIKAMSKTIIFVVFFSFFVGLVNAQNVPCDVVFSKFKLEWFNIMGIRGGGNGQRLKLTFKNTTDKVLKYVTVHYWAINAVNDIETDQFGRKEFSVNCTGPFQPNKINKLEVQIALFHPNLLTAYPYQLDITYMDSEEKEIKINKNNISLIFPSVEFINMNGNNEENTEEETLNDIESKGVLGLINGIECRIIKRYNDGVIIGTSRELNPDQIKKAKEFFSLKGKVMFNLEGFKKKEEAYAGINDGYIIFYKENIFIKIDQ